MDEDLTLFREMSERGGRMEYVDVEGLAARMVGEINK